VCTKSFCLLGAQSVHELTQEGKRADAALAEEATKKRSPVASARQLSAPAYLTGTSDQYYTAAGTSSIASTLRFSGLSSNRKYSAGVTVSTKKVELARPPISAKPNAFQIFASA
jgi:hypothetical protein